MREMDAIAIVPSVQYAKAFVAMLDDFDANDPHNTEFYAPARKDFSAYVQSLLDEEAGRNLPEGYVPCTHRWLVSSDHLVGVTRLRHNIDTPFLAQHSGHIGYDVAPSERRKGYGHLALSVALCEARRLGLGRLLLYTAEDNAPSRATIERAGGQLESISFSEFWNERLCTYRLTVPTEA
jgi:predicted acetyltransferase